MTKQIKTAVVLIVALVLLPGLLWAEEAAPQRQVRPIKERPMFTSAVEKLKLDTKQVQNWEKIIEQADKNLMEALKEAKDDADAKRDAVRAYVTEVFGQLKALLREDQQELYDNWVQELRRNRQNRQDQ